MLVYFLHVSEINTPSDCWLVKHFDENTMHICQKLRKFYTILQNNLQGTINRGHSRFIEILKSIVLFRDLESG